MIRWDREDLDAYGYLGEIEEPVAAIEIDVSGSGLHVLRTFGFLSGQERISRDEGKLREMAEEAVAEFIRKAGLHCRSCDMHACEEE